MTRRVLVVEDQKDIAALVALHLADLGMSAVLAHDGVEAAALAQGDAFDLVILDIMLPRLDGLEVLKRIRAGSRYTPVLLLTSKSTELDRVLGLELGADDYVTKPFSITELMARVKAIFRRAEAMALQGADQKVTKALVCGELTIDPVGRVVTRLGVPVELTAKEFDLLLCFAQNPGRVFTRSQLLDLVWGYSHSGYEHTVNSHINRLRAKIEADPSQPRHVLTVWSVGYKFADGL